MSTTPTPDPAPACAGCRRWRRLDPVAGECRAAPPRLPAFPAEGPAGRFGVWPLTLADGWCGEHRPRGAGP